MRNELIPLTVALMLTTGMAALGLVVINMRANRMTEETRKVCALLYQRSHTVADTLENVRVGCWEVRS